jgi:eukaryotic-like serine/threonine-protein kinase
MALAGAVLGGRYVLDQQIGSGGYSEVWHATDTVLHRPVAVKLLHPRYAQRSEVLARFQAEARHAGALAHENIARVYDYLASRAAWSARYRRSGRLVARLAASR